MGVKASPEIGEVMVKVVDRAIAYLVDEVGLESAYMSRPAVPCSKAIHACVPVSGALQGIISFSASEGTVTEIMRHLLGGEVPNEDISLLLNDTMAEMLNIIVGNATRELDKIGFRILLSSPLRDATSPVSHSPEVSQSIVYEREIQTNVGPIGVGYSAGPDDACRGSRMRSCVR